MTAPALMLAAAALAGATAAPPGAPARPVVAEKLPVPMSAMRIAATAFVGMGMHGGHPERAVGFCDYASAGSTEDMRSFYRVWLPLVDWNGREEP